MGYEKGKQAPVFIRYAVVAGSIKDETGAVLAETKDGKRVYNSDKTVRTATTMPHR